MAHKYLPKGMDKLLGEERRKILSSGEVIERLAVRPGTVVADVGCGPGYLAIPLASAVSPGGQVLAIDISQAMLDTLTQRAREAGLGNVTPIECSPTEIPCAEGVADVVLAALVVHEVPYESRGAFLEELARLVRPGGQLALLEWRLLDGPPGPPYHERLGPQIIEDLLAASPWRLEETVAIGAFHTLYLARKQEAER